MFGIFDLLASIGEWLLMIGCFVLSLFRDLLFLIELTGKFLAAIPGYFAWLPAHVSATFMLFPIVGIVLLIAGRK